MANEKVLIVDVKNATDGHGNVDPSRMRFEPRLVEADKLPPFERSVYEDSLRMVEERSLVGSLKKKFGTFTDRFKRSTETQSAAEQGI